MLTWKGLISKNSCTSKSMKSKLHLILTIIVVLALIVRAIGLYDLFYGIELLQKWMLEDFGKTGIVRLDLFYYGPSLPLVGVTLFYLLRFRKEVKLYNSPFFTFLKVVTFSDLFISCFLYSMSGPVLFG